MKIKTLEDCELPHEMRAETFTIINSSQEDSLQVEDDRGRIMVIGTSYIDERATKKLNQTKSDFKKFYEFDDVNVELQFDQRFEDDDSVYFEISGINDCINFTLSKKETKKLIKHLQKMVDYCEE